MRKGLLIGGGIITLLVGGGMMFLGGDKPKSYSAKGTASDKEMLTRKDIYDGKGDKALEEKARNRKPLIVEPEEEIPPAPVVRVESKPEVRDEGFSEKSLKKSKKEKVVYLPLSVSSTSKLGKSKPLIQSAHWMPSHRLIPCRLVNAIETRNLVSPVIAIVTEDVMHHGKIVIPAFTEIHGTIGGTRDGNRIAGSTSWRLVFNKDEKSNGKELSIKGLVLFRNDVDEPEKKPQEMSAGFMGKLYERNPGEFKKIIALSAFQSGVQAFKDKESSALGNEIDSSSARNAGIEALSKPADIWIERQLERLGDDPYYLHVGGGTAFYIYTQEPIDSSHAKKGQSRLNEEKLKQEEEAIQR